MRKEHSYKKEGAEERERRHQFGQPEGNKPNGGADATNQREFYRWVESKATTEELRAYMDDETKPAVRRRYIAAQLSCETVQDFFALTNQTHGQPKQTVEVQDLPTINCEIFGAD